jgi:glycosyltransferase involved in cell wall biosynthesis
MDVAFVTSQVYPFRKGGTEKRVYEIGRRLANDGCSVTIYGCQWWDGSPVRDFEGMTLRGVVQGGNQFSGDRRSILEALRFSAGLYGPLSDEIDRHDVVVACVSEHFPVWVASLLGELTDTPVVTTWHEVWTVDYWREYLGRLGPVGWLVQLVTANVPQRPVAVSNMTARKLSNITRLDDETVVPNGVEVEKIRSVEPADDGFDVLFVGRLIPEKNVSLLLDTFDRVAEEFDVELGVIGDGPRREALEQRAASLTHADRVTFLGFVEADEDVHRQMRAADVFVLPSEREGFGITVLESMAAGCTPVVASHPNSAASEVVDDFGLVVEPTVSALTAGLGSALEGDAATGDPVERAQTFEWDAVARMAASVYDPAMDRPNTVVETVGRYPE